MWKFLIWLISGVLVRVIISVLGVIVWMFFESSCMLCECWEFLFLMKCVLLTIMFLKLCCES